MRNRIAIFITGQRPTYLMTDKYNISVSWAVILSISLIKIKVRKEKETIKLNATLTEPFTCGAKKTTKRTVYSGAGIALCSLHNSVSYNTN